jgi:hypothetical protein
MRARPALLWLLAFAVLTSACAAADPSTGRPLLTPGRVGDAKSVLAAAAALLLAWGALVRPERDTAKAKRLRDILLGVLGALAAFGWWNFGAFNFPGFGHPSDTFHYYVGSKYFAELGYGRLYRCAAIADAEAGLRAQVESRYLRDLETNEIVRAAPVLEQPELCTAHFTPERWAEFQHDLSWFREQVFPRRWQQMQTDHGYNATPVWTAMGGTLANAIPATDAGILALRLIDPVLLVAMWSGVFLAFGWRAACIALVYWGTNYPAQYGWTGGSFFRQEWLVATVGALCALRNARFASAGVLLGAAIALRIFPVFIAVARGFRAQAEVVRAGRLTLSSDHRRLLAGGAASLAALFALSLVSGGGFSAWSGFIENSRTHLSTPLRNYMGLRTVVAYVPAPPATEAAESASEDPYAAWKDARRSAAQSREWLFVALVAGYLLLLGHAARREPDWPIAILGIGLVLVATELTSYYSAGLLAFGLLSPRRSWIGVVLCVLAAAGWWIAGSGRPLEDIYTGISLASVLFLLLTAALPGDRGPRGGVVTKTWVDQHHSGV